MKFKEWLVQKQFALLQRCLAALPPVDQARIQSAFTQRLLRQTYTVDTPIGSLSFVLLGRTSAGRARTLLTKQPATIRWIDGFCEGSVFWDIGANVGVYALYAARRGNAAVVAFEPAAVNYFLLAANCEANGLEARIDSLMLGVGQQAVIERLEVSQFASAKSFSFRSHPKRVHPSRQSVLVLSIDRLVEEFGLRCPTYIKIDTPGMSEAIIKGGQRVLRRNEVREIHMELRERSKAGQRITSMLEDCGFTLAARNVHGGSCDVTFVRSPSSRPAGDG
jgi:FkbM family methyltransferase